MVGGPDISKGGSEGGPQCESPLYPDILAAHIMAPNLDVGRPPQSKGRGYVVFVDRREFPG